MKNERLAMFVDSDDSPWKYPPACIVVSVHNGNQESQVHAGQPKKSIPLFPEHVYKKKRTRFQKESVSNSLNRDLLAWILIYVHSC